MAVWVAATGEMPGAISVLSLALMTYIAGFDILYACQDVAFDREKGLHSIPVYFGVKKAMIISTVLHVMSVLSLGWLYLLFPLNLLYPAFVAVIGILFIVEHRLVRPDDLSKIDIAFFNVNSVISVLVLAAVFFGTVL
jgi:4-hydroxybenzoate polyprenyltransferase